MLQQFVDLYINPEIQRRIGANTLSKSTPIGSAQIIFDLRKESPTIRLNSEVLAKAEYKLKEKSMNKDESEIFPDDIESLKIHLTSEYDKDCGHVTMIQLGKQWFGSFDFRYNKAIAKTHLRTAEQFKRTAIFARESGFTIPLVDNLFSCSELLAKGFLLLTPDPTILKTGHGKVHSDFNVAYKNGNTSDDSRIVFNKLSELRPKARYLKSEVDLSDSEIEEIFQKIEVQIEEIKAKIT